MRDYAPDPDRFERRLFWCLAVLLALGVSLLLGVLALVAWVIIRVTLHFT